MKLLNNNKTSIIIFTICIICGVFGITYKVLVNSDKTELDYTVDMLSGESLNNGPTLAFTVDGNAQTELDKDAFYTLNSYTCQNGSVLSWNMKNSRITINSYKKQESCVLNFTTSAGYPLLKNMLIGSYVKYSGDYGCGAECAGSWRLAYIEGEKPVIVSAGVKNDSSSGGVIESFYGDKNSALFVARKFCNVAYTGTCTGLGENALNTWPMGPDDIQEILAQAYGVFYDNYSTSCTNQRTAACGYGKDLIQVSSSYTHGKKSGSNYLYYSSNGTYYSASTRPTQCGVRPVIRLLPKIIVTGGTGTSGDPYIIEAP